MGLLQMIGRVWQQRAEKPKMLKQSINTSSGEGSKDLNAERCVDNKGNAHEVSDENGDVTLWGTGYTCYTVAKTWLSCVRALKFCGRSKF